MKLAKLPRCVTFQFCVVFFEASEITAVCELRFLHETQQSSRINYIILVDIKPSRATTSPPILPLLHLLHIVVATNMGMIMGVYGRIKLTLCRVQSRASKSHTPTYCTPHTPYDFSIELCSLVSSCKLGSFF